MVTRSGVQGPEETIDPTEFDAEGEYESEDD